MKKVKIIATIGPSSSDFRILKTMKKNGMDIGRINTKYGNEKQWDGIYNDLKKAKCEIMFDIKSLKAIEYINGIEFDWLAVSYAESKKQIEKIRKIFDKKIKIISKIETEKGIKNIDSIIEASEGIMVARGDLSKNTPFEKVPIVQKIIIKKSNKKNKFVVTATEMLLSIVDKKTPERSEISDIANAVLDGSEGVMLSEETAIGKYPSLAVKIMDKVVKATIKHKGELVNKK